VEGGGAKEELELSQVMAPVIERNKINSTGKDLYHTISLNFLTYY
jgi:hypothetical protein